MTHHAAALTYYALMSLAPALLMAVALLGVFGQQSLIPDAADYLRTVGAPRETVDAISKLIANALDHQRTALSSLVFAVLLALYGAAGAFGAAGRALNSAYRVDEGRGFVRRKLSDIGWTIVVLFLTLVTLVLVFLGGGVVNDIFGAIGLGDTAALIWKVARWPLALATAMLIYAIVYYAAPNARVPRPRIRWISPGAVVGVLAWLAASAGFFVYVSEFSYGAAYGAFAGIIVLLVWLWLTNVMLLFGAELNAEIERRRSPGPMPPAEEQLLAEKVPASDGSE